MLLLLRVLGNVSEQWLSSFCNSHQAHASTLKDLPHASQGSGSHVSLERKKNYTNSYKFIQNCTNFAPRIKRDLHACFRPSQKKRPRTICVCVYVYIYIYIGVHTHTQSTLGASLRGLQSPRKPPKRLSTLRKRVRNFGSLSLGIANREPNPKSLRDDNSGHPEILILEDHLASSWSRRVLSKKAQLCSATSDLLTACKRHRARLLTQGLSARCCFKAPFPYRVLNLKVEGLVYEGCVSDMALSSKASKGHLSARSLKDGSCSYDELDLICDGSSCTCSGQMLRGAGCMCSALLNSASLTSGKGRQLPCLPQADAAKLRLRNPLTMLDFRPSAIKTKLKPSKPHHADPKSPNPKQDTQSSPTLVFLFCCSLGGRMQRFSL